MKKVKEVSEITGLTVRTLHYYDTQGLLKPRFVNEEGYRFYDDDNLKVLGQIMILRELDYSIGDIKRFLSLDDEDKIKSLDDQIELLRRKITRSEEMIDIAKKIKKGGFEIMDLKKMDKTEYDEYAKEAKERWGNTESYRVSQERYEKRSKEENRKIGEEMMEIFTELGRLKGLDEGCQIVRSRIDELKKHISDNWYECSDEMLQGLGEMYESDERFRKNIDSYGGEGTAEFTSRAIKAYVESKK